MQEELAEQLGLLRDKSLLRVLKSPSSIPAQEAGTGGAPINFGSNDYLGLAGETFLIEAGKEALRRYGAGSGASRLVFGNHAPHKDLEDSIAAWKGTEGALAFSSGYATALGTIPSLVGAQDVVILDKLCHACIIDGARLSGALIRVYPHNNLNRLESHLQWARKHHPRARVLVATESVFSMDGDIAPLAQIVALKERYGAWLLVDEAHAAGVFGNSGGGLAEMLGLGGEIEIQMGTLSKGLGCSGGYICGSNALIQWLVNCARSLIFSTAPPPANAATATAAVRWMPSDAAKERRSALWSNVELYRDKLPEFCSGQSPIAPVIVGDNTRALELSEALLSNGFLAPAIRYPTVAKDQARIRVTLSASHSVHSIELLTKFLRGELSERERHE
jgi:glycine C-acetyltransferase/8-amino-7-oxononanoate synthase